ncbi:MAG: 2OG-Fe(II) oxygenase [Planctomycetota bacterium]
MFSVDPNSRLVARISDVLSSAQCLELISKIDSLGPETAPINTAQGTRVRTDVRNNERVMFDDVSLAKHVFLAAKDHAPVEMRGRRLVGANERFRCYRYKSGMRFAPHADGSFRRNDDEQSFYTFLLYLNDGFGGGETNLMTSPEYSVIPKEGMGLIFQHPIIHEGAEVTYGTKYVARTDLMYRRIGK